MITPRPVSDDRLVHRFAREDDEEAFAELIRRHGGLVRGVCRRVLGPGGDIEDAAQSAFLSLARDAPALAARMNPGGSLAGWIYRVAVNAALQQRRASRSRRRRETAVVRERSVERDETARNVETTELLSILDQELGSLPSQFRGPLVLCHLQGKTQQEAAEELGLSYGTFRRRLDRARQLLRARLDRRGIMASAGLIVMLSRIAEAKGTTPEFFVEATIAAARGPGAPTVAYVRPRVAEPPGGGLSSTVWSCAAKPVSIVVSYWLLAAVLAGLALPPAISIFSPSAWDASAEHDPPPARPLAPVESPGQLASR